MKTYFYIFFFIPVIGLSQQSAVEKVTEEICDSVSKIKKPLHEITAKESKNIVTKFLIDNISLWNKDLNDFKQQTGRSALQFDQYFQHALQVKCKEFRILDLKLDRYLIDDIKSREIYLKGKEFVIALEDNKSNSDLIEFFNDNLKTPETLRKLETCKEEINKVKNSTILSIIMVYKDGFTLNIGYYDYLTNAHEFQIYINFKSNTDLLIDNLKFKDKSTLIKESMEIDKIQLPPPPPPPPIKKD